MAKNKQRLDALLVERGLFPSREQAKAAIMAGEVLVNEVKIDKAGTSVAEDCVIRLLGERLRYVSRGGLKLEKAIECFGLDMTDCTVLDIGSSTGGFVDCALQNGAKKVYAVDVGTNQLAWKLRSDERVVVMEKTNARTLTEEQIPEAVDFITADVSFISLTLALASAVEHILRFGGQVAALVKPQFEAGRDAVGKGGIVRDKDAHIAVMEKIMAAFTEWGLTVQALDFSPITGADGNIEYLIHAIKGGDAPLTLPDPAEVADRAWTEHGRK